MKTIRVSDEVHRKLLRLLGERMAKTGKAQTFNDIIADLIERCLENATH
ncbi:MAG: antitoxin VapB family protein [Candidatus Bathyarchaeota archaeon]|nr:antitoxin VapB family protein [Candidatus Bathyarchaeota archaeon]